MSNTDSFIDEVTEEVRRDRLFATFRRWAWLAVVLVIVVVGGAAYVEWRRSVERQEAQALGDAMIAALREPDAAARAEALAALEAEGGAAAIADLVAAAEFAAAEDEAAAIGALDGLAEGDAAPRYADLAELKRVLLAGPGLPPPARIERLEPLTAPGRPYRLLALEQVAIARMEAGEDEAALAILQDVLADADLTQGLRQRVSQLIVVLGGEIEAG